MSVLTLADLRAEIDKNLGGRSSDEDPTNVRLNRHINLSLMRLARLHDWKETYKSDSVAIVPTGVPATDVSYTGLPSNLKELLSLMVDNSNTLQARKLTRVPVRQWDQLIGRAELLSTGEVTHYVLFHRTGSGSQSGGPTVEWFKVPDENFTLYRRYSIWPATLSADGGKPDLINKDDLIIADVTYYIFQSLGQGQKAAEWFALRSNLLGDAVREDMNRPDVSLIQRGAGDEIGVGPDYWIDPFTQEQP